jgi:hypothetical protein
MPGGCQILGGVVVCVDTAKGMLRVTPAGDHEQAADLHARFSAIKDPAEQTAFWRRLTPDQQAVILKHQA